MVCGRREMDGESDFRGLDRVCGDAVVDGVHHRLVEENVDSRQGCGVDC